jgi:lysine-N-methylase
MAERSLPVVMPAISGQAWSCHSCGTCCRKLVGHLFEHEAARLDEQDWSELQGKPYVHVGGQTLLNRRPDGACIFLTDDNLCMIHAKYGEAAKPFACRIFPFSVRPIYGGWRVSLRFDCPSVTGSVGEPLRQHRGPLERMINEELPDRCELNESAAIGRGVRADIDELEQITARFTRWVTDTDRPLDQRLVGGARVTAMLADASFEKVRGSRVGELIDLLFDSYETDFSAPPKPPSDRQRGMLWQLAFAHAEHVTMDDLRANFVARFFRRFAQLRRAGRMRKGIGQMPRIPGFRRAPTFAEVERIGQATGDDATRIGELITRYLEARLQGWTVFGPGYYGWPVWAGLNAMWSAVAVVGRLARLGAAVEGHERVTFDDAAHALGITDRAVTRLRILGTMPERARIAFLRKDDGIARLAAENALTTPSFPTVDG